MLDFPGYFYGSEPVSDSPSIADLTEWMKLLSKIVFWNLNQLNFDPGSTRYKKALEALDELAIDPDIHILAFVELGSTSLLKHLADHLGVNWDSEKTSAAQVGWNIGVLYRSDIYLAPTVLPIASKPAYSETGAEILKRRDAVGFFRMTLRGGGLRFLLAVVHFKAEDGGASFYTRKQIATWLRLELEARYQLTREPIVIGGDFNGEPWEIMFDSSGLRAYRREDFASRGVGLKLYNSTWRLAGDSTTLADLRNSSRRNLVTLVSSTPGGTYDNQLIDGVIVSGDWLTNSQFELLDSGPRILTNSKWHHVKSGGVHHAGEEGAGPSDVISDHLPVVVDLRIG